MCGLVLRMRRVASMPLRLPPSASHVNVHQDHIGLKDRRRVEQPPRGGGFTHERESSSDLQSAQSMRMLRSSSAMRTMILSIVADRKLRRHARRRSLHFNYTPPTDLLRRARASSQPNARLSLRRQPHAVVADLYFKFLSIMEFSDKTIFACE